ncbi:MAG: tyrosine-type recombinase/integrase [Candidatus Hydrogenedens sp.]|nr:tyrosine-type recombinase/integrase [Candidatus Hydrogenedens sp.]
MKRTNTNARRFRFTHALLEALPAHDPDSPSREMEYSDAEVVGLRLLASKTGRRFFYFRYRIRGRKRALRIGEFPSVSLKDARQRCHEAKAALARDADPAAEREERLGIPTFVAYAVDYLAWAKQHKKSWRDDESRINQVLAPRFGKLTLDAITPRDIQRMHAEIRERTSNSTANRFLGLMGRMYSLANEWQVYDKNPAHRVKKVPENAPRERFLSREEIGSLLEALDASPSRSAADALKFLVFTGLRKNEALRLEWRRANLAEGTVYLAQTKSGKPRTVVLNTPARELLQQRWEAREGEHPFVFPGRVAGQPLNNPTKVFDEACRRAEITGACIHTLRHSFASLAINAGATLYDVSKLLGHSTTRTTTRYAHHERATLLRASEQAASQMAKTGAEG